MERSMGFQRSDRVADRIQRELGDVLQRGLKDPLVGFVTVTGVDVSPDLRAACVFISILGDEEAKRRSIKGLHRARRYLRREVAARVQLKYVPQLRFQLDTSLERAARIESLLSHPDADAD